MNSALCIPQWIERVSTFSPDVNRLGQRFKCDLQPGREACRGRGRSRLRRATLNVVDLRHVRRLLHLEPTVVSKIRQ